jgi:hypothetical protein
MGDLNRFALWLSVVGSTLHLLAAWLEMRR